MKLEIKHIAPYLPYGLKIQTQDKNGILIKTVDGIYEQYKDGSFMLYWQENYGTIQASGNIKLILRPLSDLFNGNYESILDEFSISSLGMFETAFLSEIRSLNAFDFVNYTTVLLLLENHFDIYGLIEKGLAIGINTLQK